MLIVITGTVSPDKGVKDLVIRDSSERLRQYQSALEKILDSAVDAKVIFCDNSGFGVEAFEDIKQKANADKIRFETLSFNGNDQAVIEHGKGYGEGEIMEYVLSNSSLVRNEEFMIKITGRLMVDNISELVKSVKKDTVYFNIPNIHRRDIYDTRIYGMPVAIFERYFRDRYKKVNDEGGYYLEHAYTDAIKDNNLKVRNFPLYPRIVGVSGSGGISYEYTEWKSKVRDVLSLFNVYGRLSRNGLLVRGESHR